MAVVQLKTTFYTTDARLLQAAATSDDGSDGSEETKSRTKAAAEAFNLVPTMELGRSVVDGAGGGDEPSSDASAAKEIRVLSCQR